MDLTQYRNAVVLHGYRLEKMIVERNKLNAEIERVADLIAANANFLPEAERAERLQKLEQMVAERPGFTDSVRNILRKNPSHWANAIAVRDLLIADGYNMSRYSNPLASIHTILKRLTKADEVEANVLKDGDVYYRWKT
jgi:hypothetical protein